MSSAGDVTAARTSVPFPPVFTSTSACDPSRVAREAREVRSPPHRGRLRAEHVIPVSNGCRIPRALDVSVHPCELLLHQGGMRLTVCALLRRVCRVG